MNKENNSNPPKHRGPMAIAEKPKDFLGSLKKLCIYAKEYVVFILIAILFSSVGAILQIVAPNKLSELTDTITQGIIPSITVDDISDIMSSSSISLEDKIILQDVINNIKNDSDTTKINKYINMLPDSILERIEPEMDIEFITNLVILLSIIYIVGALFNFIQGVIMVKVSNGFARKLRTKISVKINDLPLKYYDRNSVGDTLSRITNDVDTINMSMHQSLGSLVSALTLLIGSLIMMFVTNYIMAFTAVFTSLIGIFFISLLLKVSQKYFVRRQEEIGNINGHIEEVYTNHRIVKLYNGKRSSDKEFDAINKRVFDCNLKSQFLSGLMNPIMAFIGDLSYVLVCVVGALLVMKGSITFGVIVAFIVYIRLFTNPLRQIAQCMTQLQSAVAACERVFEFLEEEEMSKEDNITRVLTKDSAKGNIEFKNVKFSYNKNKTVIKDFSFVAKPGEKIAIVGPTGAGKTTLVNLLMKFYEINDGDILIDGISTKELSRENIHDLFIMVLQNTWLFNGTIRDNIKYNNESVTDKEIMNACNIVGLDHFISTLPNGLDSVLGDNESVSAGQKQLLTIARGMIKDSPFLILDEATSNVDTRTEEMVQSAMDKLTEGRTSFIIAHRLSTIKNANHILVMNDGNIIEQGTHEELMEQNGFYADLYNSQFSKNVVVEE